MNKSIVGKRSPGTIAFGVGLTGFQWGGSGKLLLLLPLFALLLGCQGPKPEFQDPAASQTPTPVAALKLREGDVLRIDFPGAPNLNTRETIKMDGRISLMVGEVTAAGKTVAELQKELLALYGPQLVTKAVTVSLENSTFPVYVTGAVPRTGRITVDRPMTALEAVMEAGADLARANLKAVRVTRTISGKTEIFKLNLDAALKGKSPDAQPFYLKPSDIIYVPEKFQWF